MPEPTDDWRGLIELNPKILRGKPVLKRTRVAVEIVVGALAAGMTVDEVCEEYCVKPEQVRAALAYAADIVADEKVYALAHR